MNYELAEQISKNINEDYAMMDTSDGLADALYKIAEAGNKTIVLDFSKVEYNPDLRKFFPNEYKKMMLFGGEDYKIVAVIPENFADKYKFKIIGRVIEKNNAPLIVENYNKENTYITSLKECFNHFN